MSLPRESHKDVNEVQANEKEVLGTRHIRISAPQCNIHCYKRNARDIHDEYPEKKDDHPEPPQWDGVISQNGD